MMTVAGDTALRGLSVVLVALQNLLPMSFAPSTIDLDNTTPQK